MKSLSWNVVCALKGRRKHVMAQVQIESIHKDLTFIHGQSCPEDHTRSFGGQFPVRLQEKREGFSKVAGIRVFKGQMAKTDLRMFKFKDRASDESSSRRIDLSEG